ncbi:Lysosomal acid phosphatase [Channa argus]|uniref:Lysosomal acid phosphatase n=1 Tax=Channa argus TaxID=215402 RepID=A0A6G1QUY1_CHAAH|nr:Lysosomal acid phosphatase [Channa argus]KAK2880299.1 hypothetical protein Q8A73_022997 [Channa argus]
MWGRFFRHCGPNLRTLYITALLVLTVGSVCGQAAAQRKLVYVTVLFRHGDRSPVFAYPTDPYKEEDWPQGFGQLSQEGMRQHYELGQFLRKRYTGFLNKFYDRNEVLVLSTDYDRTLMSAQSTLAGLYPPSGRQIFMKGLKWQPIPVHAVPKSQEKLLLFPLGNCPRYQQLMNETHQTQEFLTFTATYKNLMDLVEKKAGFNKTEVNYVWGVQDTLFCQSLHNMSLPAWVTPDVMDKLNAFKDFALEILFGVYKQQEKSRLQGGILLGEIVKNLSKMAVPKPNQKLMMLSSHDTTVAAIQASLNVFNGQQPPYASCQIFELYREADGSYSVSLFYRNDSAVEPYPQQLPGCSLNCPLDEFVRITKPFISDDRDKECQVPSEGTDSNGPLTQKPECYTSRVHANLDPSCRVICLQKEKTGSRQKRHLSKQ